MASGLYREVKREAGVVAEKERIREENVPLTYMVQTF
jgi:hypothetical protein